MSTQGIDQLLGELRAVSALATNKPATPIAGQESVPGVDFSDVLGSALKDVNSLQQASQSLQNKFELGDETVNLHDVMISLQKASLSFQTMVQVRNKLVSAYQEVMNTQI